MKRRKRRLRKKPAQRTKLPFFALDRKQVEQLSERLETRQLLDEDYPTG